MYRLLVITLVPTQSSMIINFYLLFYNLSFRKRPTFVQNPNLKELNVDNLYHINITTDNLPEIKRKFGDVKYVCLAGSVGRVQKFAQMCYEKLKDVYDLPADAATDDIALKAGR